MTSPVRIITSLSFCIDGGRAKRKHGDSHLEPVTLPNGHFINKTTLRIEKQQQKTDSFLDARINYQVNFFQT